MVSEKRKKIRRHLRALEEQLDQLKSNKAYVVYPPTFQIIEREIKGLHALDPQDIDGFDGNRLLTNDRDAYLIDPLRAAIGSYISQAKMLLEDEDTSPAIFTQDFAFIREKELREILQNDYSELQRSYQTQCWKAALILAGGLVEGMLLNILQEDEPKSESAKRAPQGKSLDQWELGPIIDVCLELDLISAGLEKLSHSVREYRNLIHPARQVRKQIKIEQEEARIAVEVVNALYRELSR